MIQNTFNKKELDMIIQAVSFQYTNVSHINKNKTNDLKIILDKLTKIREVKQVSKDVVVKDKFEGSKQFYIVLSDDSFVTVTKEEFMANEIGKPLRLEAKGVGYK